MAAAKNMKRDLHKLDKDRKIEKINAQCMEVADLPLIFSNFEADFQHIILRFCCRRVWIKEWIVQRRYVWRSLYWKAGEPTISIKIKRVITIGITMKLYIARTFLKSDSKILTSPEWHMNCNLSFSLSLLAGVQKGSGCNNERNARKKSE